MKKTSSPKRDTGKRGKAASEEHPLTELFLDELADIYYAENLLVKALPKMVKAATSEELKEAFAGHLEETVGHVEKVGQVFEAFGKPAKGKKCEAMVGLLEEADGIAKEFKGKPVLDAALISAAQKVEHYEIATYGTLHEWATIIGNAEGAALLEEILEQEKAADEKLTEVAREVANTPADSSESDE